MKKRTAIWAAAHAMTPEQVESLKKEGFKVVLLAEENPKLWQELKNMQIDTDVVSLAERLIAFCVEFENPTLVQPAGAPNFHFLLGGKALDMARQGLCIRFAFSKRVSEDVIQPDGTIKKVSIFKHEGWV
jgi:hypothetical protein